MFRPLSIEPRRGEPLPESCDVVVIGAGAGGLTTAALLSQAGLATVVLESDTQVGGYLAGFQRRGFSFNTSIEWLNQCGPGGFVYQLFHSLGGAPPPECPPMRRIRRFKSDAYDYLLTSDPNELRDCLLRDFPADAAGIRAFFRDAERLGRRLAILDRNIMGTDTLTWAEKVRRNLRGLLWALPVLRYVLTPVDRGLRRYFGSNGAEQVFGSHQTMMSVMVSVAWAYAGNFQSCPRGGSRSLALWLCERIRAAGSRVVLNSRVERVLLDEQGAAGGVVLADGRTIRARYVVAASDIRRLYEQMLPVGAVPARLLKALRQAEIYHSCFSIFLGLDCDPVALGFGGEAVNLTRSGLERPEHSGGDPHKTIITVLSPSVLDPTLAPPGKGTLIIHCPAYLDYQEQWRTGAGLARGEAYQAAKKEFAEILLDRLEATCVPGLRQHIEVMEIATPVTYLRYTGNAMGSISGVKPTVRNVRAGVAHYQTPVRRLLLGGHCGEYGGGVPMAVRAAANASLIVLKEMRPQAYEHLKSVINDPLESCPEG
ncbi:MAG: NAD(P)/FAD-dependent oxidoreductase [Desulfobulbaceae bacterium]|nr:NAD(P)/FAD-dependent oxidoreductase [Desulfobulbaceae bacterium]